jgi:hypothetical protein
MFIEGNAGGRGKEVREPRDFQGDQNDQHLWTCRAPNASEYAPGAAAKHLDKGWTLHYKPLQGITG